MKETTTITSLSYFEDRIHQQMGLSPEDYTLELFTIDERFGGQTKRKLAFLQENKKGGIDIYPYTIDRRLIPYEKNLNRKTITAGEHIEYYKITRLHPNQVTDGRKYHIPKGQGTHPFFPPYLLRLYEKKEKIKTLFLTEGYLKAITGGKFGIPVVGLSSITHYADKDGNLYEDIIKIIRECEVENVIMIYDGDCLNLSENALNNGDDISKRPYSFFSSALNMRNLFVPYEVDFYFSHIRSERIKGNPKGLDDLLLSIGDDDRPKAILNLKKLHSDKQYFYKLNITGSLSKLKKYFALNNETSFYERHREKIGLNKFKFLGTEYQFNLETDKIEIVMPEAANRYIRVGDDYFEILHKPTSKGQTNTILARRMKSTIKDDHGSKIFRFIPKYKDFVNLPSHQDYKKVINGFYNLYNEFTHEPAEGTWDNTQKFLKHIFGEQYELGLDYVQLLYEQPTQVMPILCLVSEENGTGKTMFAKWLGEIFKGNTAIIGNTEISSNFNGHLQGKLVIAIDESFIEKKLIVEKIKSLATATELPMTRKGKDTVFIDYFGKIILLSNNVDTFITASEYDVRYWVREIPKPEKEDPALLDKMIKEIPAFLYYLQKRQMHTKKETRAWFNYEIIKTPAFEKVIEQSRPSAYKIIYEELKERFENTRIDIIEMSLQDIKQQFFDDKRVQKPYIKKIIEKFFNYEKDRGRYRYPVNTADELPTFVDGNSTFYRFFAKDFIDEKLIKHKIKDQMSF